MNIHYSMISNSSQSGNNLCICQLTHGWNGIGPHKATLTSHQWAWIHAVTWVTLRNHRVRHEKAHVAPIDGEIFRIGQSTDREQIGGCQGVARASPFQDSYLKKMNPLSPLGSSGNGKIFLFLPQWKNKLLRLFCWTMFLLLRRPRSNGT